MLHKIKSVRNNSMKNDISYLGGKACWAHVRETFAIDVVRM